MNELNNNPFFKHQKNKDAYGSYYYNVKTSVNYLSNTLGYKETKLD
jgi:hypothetical protein